MGKMDFMEKSPLCLSLVLLLKNKITLGETVTLQIMGYCVLSEKEEEEKKKKTSGKGYS